MLGAIRAKEQNNKAVFVQGGSQWFYGGYGKGRDNYIYAYVPLTHLLGPIVKIGLYADVENSSCLLQKMTQSVWNMEGNMKKTKQILITIGLSVVMLAGCGMAAEPQQTKEPSGSQAVSGESVSTASNLKDAFAKEFSVGVAINPYQLSDPDTVKVVTDNFNSVTLENAMKPESLLDQRGSEKSKDGTPAINEDVLDEVLTLAKDNGLKVRGHCLVWHSQTPEWFFCDKYDAGNKKVKKAVMRKRMESYIRKVLTYCQKNYPGVVYAWDVVNEAFDDGGGYRTESNWFEVYGDASYIQDAFTFARKYADKDVKLFLNDYNTYIFAKTNSIAAELKKLSAKGLVDGVGCQSHWDMSFPDAGMLQDEINTFSEIKGLEIQYTEIDMHNTDNSEKGLKEQADRYKEFFDVIVKADREGKADVTNVTFWGLNDETTWLTNNKGETSYPLLFDKNNQKKPCYDSLLEAAKQK